MKSRVTLIVTLVSLVALALLMTYNCSRLADRANDEIEHDLYVACQLTGDFSRTDSMQTRADTLKTLKTTEGAARALFASDGSVVYASDERYSSLTEEDIAMARTNEAVLKRHPNPEGKMALYVIYRYEDGEYLLYARPMSDTMTILLNNKALVLLAVIYGLTIVLAVIVILDVMQRETMVKQVMSALDRFSDGNFDARVEGFRQEDPNAAEYNAIITRIQDRIFKQKNRNHVLSSVMSQMQNGIVAVDQNLNVIYITPVAKKLLGIVGNPEYKNINEVSRDVKLDEVFTEAMRQEGVYTNEVAARTAVGRGHRPLRLYVSPMRREEAMARTAMLMTLEIIVTENSTWVM